MGLDLQLHRISALLKGLGNPHLNTWRSVHIAGTNGKGSVCTYLSHILTANNIKSGKFTSPHLKSRNDSIQIDNVPVSNHEFLDWERKVIDKDEELGTECTEFEILTATAFQIFKAKEVNVAVIEVGLGGRLDSTNVLDPQFELATGITKIGLDHEGLLGDTLAKIAFEKSGIIKNGVPCIVDGSNDNEALEVLRGRSREEITDLYEVAHEKDIYLGTSLGFANEYTSPLLGDFQRANLNIALKIMQVISENPSNRISITKEETMEGLSRVSWPGRLQEISLTSNGSKAIIDGAHNTQAVTELAKFVNTNLRSEGKPVTYVIGVTEGKNIDGFFSMLIKPGDYVILTQFKEGIEGMPWIKPCDTTVLEQEVMKVTSNYEKCKDLETALEKAEESISSSKGSLVICGSLYLAADVLRLTDKNK